MVRDSSPSRPHKFIPSISIIIPILNEAAGLADCLASLQTFRRQGCELIVVDGGSIDNSTAIASSLADRVLAAPRGRAIQMNAGAKAASSAVLWFLHSDSQPPEGASQLIGNALAKSRRDWGRFDVYLSGRGTSLRVVETLMNWRSRLSGIATGDQGIFVRRVAFLSVGGYPTISLMEDIALSRSLKRLSRPICLHQRLVTSSRRWEQHGVLRTILLMWYLRMAYFLGVDPDRLVNLYYKDRSWSSLKRG